MNDAMSFSKPELDAARRTGFSRHRRLSGLLTFRHDAKQLIPRLSGLLGLTVSRVEHDTDRARISFSFKEAMRTGYAISVSINTARELETEQNSILRMVGKGGFVLEIAPISASDLATTSVSLAVEGYVDELTPDNRTLDTASLIQDVNILHNMLRNEVEYGFISVMASASIKSRAQLDEAIAKLKAEETKHQTAIGSDPDAEKKLASVKAKLDRSHRLLEATHYYDAAYEFGDKWGDYYVTSMAQELNGRHIPLATGGGPGLMQAAAEGAARMREIDGGKQARAGVVAIDTLFVEDERFNMALDPASLATAKIRCNDFAMRELALINFAHVVVVFPGGVGTAWELFEVLSKLQTKHLRRQRIKLILYGATFWKPFVEMMDHFRKIGTINNHDDLIWLPDTLETRPEHTADFLSTYLGEVVDSVDEVFASARAHLHYLRDENLLGLPGY